MDAENNNMELDGQMTLFGDEGHNEKTDVENNDDALTTAIEEQLSKIRRQSMLLGFQVAAQSVLDKIIVFERTQGKKSANDYKRLIKDIRKFVETALSRKVTVDGETEPVNNDTKLMEGNYESNTNESN